MGILGEIKQTLDQKSVMRMDYRRDCFLYEDGNSNN